MKAAVDGEAVLDRFSTGLGGVIAAVRDRSPAARGGLQPGDRVVAIDGVVPRDLIDVRHQTQGQHRVTVDFVRGASLRSVRLSLGGAVDLGVDFEQPTFDPIRQCNNNCEFCFIRGLPKGLRRSLYIRDDDYRYSFLFGNFLTLTNLEQDDWHRLAYQRLSPLRVSVHATDPEVRARMLSHPDAPPIVPWLRRLGQGGVKVYAQVVLCPPINDGPVLERTVFELAELHDVIESVAVVPVGVSDHLPLRQIRAVTSDDATSVVRALVSWHRGFRRSFGRGFVYPSDELFLMAGLALPGERFYDDFGHLGNGVGLTRVLLSDWRRHRHRLPDALASPRRVAWLCGRAAQDALTHMALEANQVLNLEVEVRAVENTLFGASIGVSGLMSGRDAAEALRGTAFDVAVLPRSAFGHEGERTLDDWTVEDIERACGVPIRLGRNAGELIAWTVTQPSPQDHCT